MFFLLSGEFVIIPPNEPNNEALDEADNQVMPNTPEFGPDEPDQEFIELFENYSIDEALHLTNDDDISDGNISDFIGDISLITCDGAPAAAPRNEDLSNYENPQAIIERLEKEIMETSLPEEDLPNITADDEQGSVSTFDLIL